MQNIGLNSNLKLGEKTFHIQTSFHADTLKISTGIFDGGTVIDQRERSLDTDVPPVQYGQELKVFHEYIISDLEMLFAIAERAEASDHIPSRKSLGTLYLKKGFVDHAIDQFQYIREHTKREQHCNFELGQCFHEKGDYEKALEYLQAAVIDTNQYADLHLILADTYRTLKSYKFSINHIEKAININEQYHEAYFLYALILLESIIEVPHYSRMSSPENRLKQALDFLNKAISLSPRYDHHLLESVLELFNDSENIEQAISLMERERNKQRLWKKQQIDDSEFYLKFMFAGLDQDEQGVDHYIHSIEKMIQDHPEYADLHFSLGKAYLVKTWHFLTKSSNAIQNAVEQNPEYIKAQKTLRLLENDKKGFLNLLKTVLE